MTPSAVQGLLATLRHRDAATCAHTEGVARMAAWVAGDLDLSPADREQLHHVALLHDLGKVAIPDAILLKPGPLTAWEREIVCRHPEIGARMVSATGDLGDLAPGVRSHHERWDGDGYPDGLRGPSIPLVARIVAVCDAFNAMTSDRPYRPAMTTREAVAELEAGAGTQFDPAIVAVVARRLLHSTRRTLRAA